MAWEGVLAAQCSDELTAGQAELRVNYWQIEISLRIQFEQAKYHRSGAMEAKSSRNA